ncbi:hypothetical protein CEXT_548951 [Caerostris extrusa]|uniref:Uncharacterized protein n=1 Tax=Caerostris extrusa TaxID=172846 RepID=A0AAV4M3T1_CAEEX|nr:hypothetical protein CEXT_548951 [Caerostris extrusa]
MTVMETFYFGFRNGTRKGSEFRRLSDFFTERTGGIMELATRMMIGGCLKPLVESAAGKAIGGVCSKDSESKSLFSKGKREKKRLRVQESKKKKRKRRVERNLMS